MLPGERPQIKPERLRHCAGRVAAQIYPFPTLSKVHVSPRAQIQTRLRLARGEGEKGRSRCHFRDHSWQRTYNEPRSYRDFSSFPSHRELKRTVACHRRAVKHKAGLGTCHGLQARGEDLHRGEMQLEFVSYLSVRASGVYLILELLILALNPIPDTAEKWLAKKRNLTRRLSYYAAP